MEYAIVLRFDDKSTEQIQKITDHVANCTGNDHMIFNHIPPHITIADFYTDDNADIYGIAADIAASTDRFDIPVVSVGIFNPAVVFASPVMNKNLLSACENANKILLSKDLKCNHIYTPYNWVPHISLAVKLDDASMQNAIKAALEKFQPVMAAVEKLSIAVCDPYREIKTFDL